MAPRGVRGHGRLAELRAAELSLGDAEAGALLVAAGVNLRNSRVTPLVERTEGSPAAMYLSALSLRRELSPSAQTATTRPNPARDPEFRNDPRVHPPARSSRHATW